MEGKDPYTLTVTDLSKRYPLPRELLKKGIKPSDSGGKDKDKEKERDNRTPRFKRALDKVSFTLAPGLYGLLGPNGAGKSTLINIITGTLTPTSGTVKWNDVNIKKLGKEYRRQIGFMPQQQTLYDAFTGKQFLAYMCALKEIDSRQAPKEIEEAARRVNLTGELDKRLSAYSGGMKQRLLAASAVLGRPSLVIFDEPTRGLDPKERYRLRAFMKELGKESIVLTATHVVSDVESVADEILLLKEGRLVDKAPVSDLIDRYAPGQGLERVYLNIFDEEGVY